VAFSAIGTRYRVVIPDPSTVPYCSFTGPMGALIITQSDESATIVSEEDFAGWRDGVEVRQLQKGLVVLYFTHFKHVYKMR
jgi:hypothetical protein